VSARTLQQGQAAIILLLLVGLGVIALVYGLATPAKESIERDKKTAAALVQAKEALLGFAAGIDLTAAGTPRPGDLPCPDFDNDGTADTPCAGAALGRLPWQRLGLPDLRDGDGERLWYAVSSNFKNNPRTACGSPGLSTCLNSDTRGTITVRNNTGAVINNGNDPWGSFNPSGVIAVIIAPGAVLQRQGAAAPQDRSCTGDTNMANCLAAQVCSSTVTALCNPVNYLDVFTGGFGTEDNSNFADLSAVNGFISGPILDANGNPIVNDRILTITYADLMPLLEKRVAKEALNCLNAYASVPQNGGRYPWAAPIANWPSFADQTGTQYGRLPDGPFNATLLGLGGSVTNLICSLTPALCMFNGWPASCTLTQGTWWNNWKELVLYGVAVAYQPADSLLGVPPSGGCGSCLTVDPPSAAANKRVAVIVAGKRLAAVGGGQPRALAADKSNPSNYAEDQNNNAPAPANIYEQHPATPTFNDILLFQQ
jgi:hypothetical protein